MMRFLLPLLCAVLGLAAASCNQPDEPPAPAADAPASSARATSHGAAAAVMPASTAETQAQTDRTQASSSDETFTPPGSQEESPAQSSDASSGPDAPTGTAIERRASTLIGMPVVAEDGSSLGVVKDIIFDPQGRATHLVVGYAAAPAAAGTGTDGKLTALPWDAAMASIRDGQLVLDGAKLQSAPSFTQDAWPNLDDPSWSAATDAYWRKAVRAAIEANPGAPIDSTSRQRGRPPRGGG